MIFYLCPVIQSFLHQYLPLIKLLQFKGKELSFDRKVLWGMCFCALAMWLSDAFENKQLLLLTSFGSVQEVPVAILRALKFWTTMKWGIIFFACAVAAVYYVRYFSLRRPAGIIFVLLYASCALSGALGLSISKYRSIIEATNMIIAVAWCLSMIHAGMLAFSRSPQKS